ncbi:DNA polymerase III subunit beta [Ochrobactrum sp. MR28]|nr:DNA polymerase III subunit beta [Ochrobactrum sp. MR28]MBX8818848.1 DNA polymerase III subunit beta [Ochrobactrum sp. MR31]
MTDLFTISRGALLPALSAVIKAVERRSTIPILQYVRLSYVDAALMITGTNLDVEICAKVAVENLHSFSGFTLPAGVLHDAVRKLPDSAEIKFQMEGKKDSSSFTISAGRSHFKLNSLPGSDFPEMAVADFTHRMTMPAKQLATALNLVSFAISTEETRYYLNGIYWHVTGIMDDALLGAVATDGHRLAFHKMPMPEELSTDMPGVIIPRRTINLLPALAAGDGDVFIELNSNKIRFTFADGTVLSSKLIDGTFPEYEHVIPRNNENVFKIDVEPVKQAIDRVLTISNDKGNGCKFQFENDHLSLSVINPDQGTADDQVLIELLSGEPVNIGFNSKYCLEMLGVFDSKEAFISLGDAGSPALIHPSINGERSETTSFVLMPMRL